MERAKRKRAIAFVLIILCCLNGCANHKYLPSHYTKDEVYDILQNNEPLFRELVFVVSTSTRFYDEGRVSPYANADITSPYDEGLDYFDEPKKTVIKDFFQFQPYMILFDYAKRFVKITFLASDTDHAYNVLFWIESERNPLKEMSDYAHFLSQDYHINIIMNDCIMYYK